MKDILKYTTNETKVRVTAGEVDAFRSRLLTKAGARTFHEGQIFSASCFGDIKEIELYAMCAEHSEMGLPSKVILPKGKKSHHSILSRAVLRVDQLQDFVEKQLKILKSEAPHFQYSGHVVRTESKVEYGNDQGADFSKESCFYKSFLQIRRKGSPNIMDAYFYSESLISADDPMYSNWVVECLQAYDNVVPLTSGKYPILMLPDRSMMDKIGESCRADLYHSGAAPLSGKMGEQLFNDQFELVDCRMDIDHGIFSPFDFEGVEAEHLATPLYKKGQFVGLISDLKNQDKYGAKSTGNGFRRYDSAVQLGFSGLQVSFGKRGFRDILKDIDQAIVLEMAIGGDITELNDFSTPVQLGYLVKNGQVVGRLPECSVSGNLSHLFGKGLLEVAQNGFYQGSSNPCLLMEMDLQSH